MLKSAPFILGLAAALGSAGAPEDAPRDAAVRAAIVRTAGRFELIRDGRPFFVKGAGGADHLDQLAAAGGNSIRTWGVGKSTRKLLDEAHAAGLTVTLGIWLQRVGAGFDYGSEDALARQRKMVREAVETYRGHPALLMWSLGNEGEGHGGDPRYYEHLEDLATMVHELDPDHPTMTVIAELGEDGRKVKDLERLAPSIDAVGINSYGGIRSVPRRYREAGGTRPYLITEFGPKGHWESPRTDWGTPIELSSTETAALYRSAYQAAVAGQPLCIGAYVFLWGQKQETTATWFGMYLEDGTRLGAVDVMTELWSGEAPENRSPEISALGVSRASVGPGAIIEATLEAADVDSDELRVDWVLRSASPGNGSWGAREDSLEEFPEAILAGKRARAKVRLPQRPGAYRLFAYVRDSEGNGAVHNVPLRVVE
ncbi:MAG: glycoside hydrolase family 2 TIM barrel-domain containing protein [Planctomycetota bacterium]|nr:glycoside hydrolase family 2 TIM barrel-domain containing protein [Planctomycetota bacterium]